MSRSYNVVRSVFIISVLLPRGHFLMESQDAHVTTCAAPVAPDVSTKEWGQVAPAS